MIVIESKRKKLQTLQKKYPTAIFADVTSKSTGRLLHLSPFYPHGGIPVPMSPGYTATCVESIWQGLKVFEHADIDTDLFQNATMRGIKRTARKYGKPIGHRAGVHSPELLGYIEARKQIYIPTYRWMLEHYCMDIIHRLRHMQQVRRSSFLTTTPMPMSRMRPSHYLMQPSSKPMQRGCTHTRIYKRLSPQPNPNSKNHYSKTCSLIIRH